MKWKKTLCTCLALMAVTCSGCGWEAGSNADQSTTTDPYGSSTGQTTTVTPQGSGTTKGEGQTDAPDEDASKLAYYEKLVGELQAELLAMKAELFETRTEYEERIAELEAGKNEKDEPQTKAFTYTVSGDSVTITAYTGSDVHVQIPSTIDGKSVTALGDKVFMNNKKVESVVVPEGVKTVGWFAFSGCISLSAVSMPASVESISYGAFENCPASLTVFCPSDSYAAKYAKSYGIATAN